MTRTPVSKHQLDLHIVVIQEPIRLDLAVLAELQKHVPGISRAGLKTWFQKKHILLQGKQAPASTLLKPGTYKVTLHNWPKNESGLNVFFPKAYPASQGCFLPIIYEDEDLLVVHKKTGVPSIPQSPDETHTAVSAALAHSPELQNIGRGGYEPAILHRLDTGTSGLLVFAKHQNEFERLHTFWKQNGVVKLYRAIVRAGSDKNREPPLGGDGISELKMPHTIDLFLAHDAQNAKRMLALPHDWERSGRKFAIRGRPLPALTRLLNARAISGPGYDLEIQIETGVMHQIRCHLASLGWPVLGDPIYRGIPSLRLWLHAWRIMLPLASGTKLWLQAELPEHWPGG